VNDRLEAVAAEKIPDVKILIVIAI
jgi:hypothetical protein